MDDPVKQVYGRRLVINLSQINQDEIMLPQEGGIA